MPSSTNFRPLVHSFHSSHSGSDEAEGSTSSQTGGLDNEDALSSARGTRAGSAGVGFKPYTNRDSLGTTSYTFSPLQTPSQGRPVANVPALYSPFYEFDDNDDLHDYDPSEKNAGSRFSLTSGRGWANLSAIFVVTGALLTLFGGWPIIAYFEHERRGSVESGSNAAGFNLGGINATGQHPTMISGFPPMIDAATPESALTRTGFDNNRWDLVFSDEFETDGRTFYNGDDPYWEGVDLHYWGTNDFQWYDPGAITTANGKLVITMTQEPIHGLNFKSGMLQGWNKLCFSGATYYEVSVSLPGNNVIGGFWPGVWTEGNLGRPGYGATVDGTWPYSYDSCDIGTLPNQTYVNGTGPEAALYDSAGNERTLSYLPGQRLSACTCVGDDHPGPRTASGGLAGRSAPEIDIIEAQIDIARSIGDVSQSLQCAPFDADYQSYNGSDGSIIYNPAITEYNSYLGGVYQQAVSGVTDISSANYADTSGGFGVYGMEVYSTKSDRENAYVTWVSGGVRSWTARAEGLRANPRTEVGPRLIAEEPMALIFNFGLSNNFQSVDFNRLDFPNYMYIEYVRVYQRPGLGVIGCDPADHPTADYINSHIDAYMDPNITTYEMYLELHPEQSMPRNSLQGAC